MKRFSPLGIIAACLPAVLAAASFDQGQAAYEAGDFKQAIACYRQALLETDDVAQVKLSLALAYLRDQDDEAAFSTYLEALESVKKKEWRVSEEEKELFDEGLQSYLHPKGATLREEAIELARRFGPIAEEHPDWRLINFLVASAHANLGMFDDFFPRFFRSYESFPNHFMAHKIKGMLHVKLMERLSDMASREAEGLAAVAAFKQAIEAYPQDFSLYKMVVTLSPYKRGELVAAVDRFIQQDILVPRRDIVFYVDHLLEVGEKKLAGAFLEKARSWYPVSRQVAAASERLKRHEELN